MNRFQTGIGGMVLILALLRSAFAEKPAINGVLGGLTWKNVPLAWHVEHGSELTIRSGKETDWFVDPFDGTVHNTAPMLLFMPADDYVLSTKVKVGFNTKWDAGALMVWADDHHWAKLSFELSPAKQGTMVTVVTRGVSDDCNSIPISGNTVYIQIAKSGKAYVFYSSTDGKSWQVLGFSAWEPAQKPGLASNRSLRLAMEPRSFSPRSTTARKRSRTSTITKTKASDDTQ